MIDDIYGAILVSVRCTGKGVIQVPVYDRGSDIFEREAFRYLHMIELQIKPKEKRFRYLYKTGVQMYPGKARFRYSYLIAVQI